MIDSQTKKFILDFMDISCEYCHEVKQFTECDGRFTKCLEKAYYVAKLMRDKGWMKDSENGDTWKKKTEIK